MRAAGADGARPVAGVTLGELAVRFGLELHGDPQTRIEAVATLREARPGTITFLANPRYRRFLGSTAASAVVLDAAAAAACPVAALVGPNPYAAFARIAASLNPQPGIAPGVHPSAVVAPGAQLAASTHVGALASIATGCQIGEHAVVGPGCVLERDASVGAGSRLVARVTLYHGVCIGKRCLLHAGVVIGADGFGVARDEEGWVKVPQLGGVRIGDDVEIGANTTIDRGSIGDTVIEDGVKLDNQIQVGHNVRIGAHTAIAGCTGISGSTTIGKRCLIGGAVGFAGHLEVADEVIVTGLSFVSRSIDRPGVYSSGLPALEAGAWRRTVARLRHLDELFDRVRRLEGRAPDKEPGSP